MCLGEISKVRISVQSSRGKYLCFLKVPEFPYKTVNDRWKEALLPKTSSISSAVSTEHRLVTDTYRRTYTGLHPLYRHSVARVKTKSCDGQTDRQTDQRTMTVRRLTARINMALKPEVRHSLVITP